MPVSATLPPPDLEPAAGRPPSPAARRAAVPAVSPAAAVRYLLADYLRDWGLRDPAAVSEIVEEIVRRTGPARFDLEAAEGRRLFQQSALREAVDYCERVLLPKSGGDAAGVTAAAGVMPRIEEVLYACPNAARPVHSADDEAEAVCDSVPVVPDQTPREMGPPAATRPLRFFRPTFWLASLGLA